MTSAPPSAITRPAITAPPPSAAPNATATKPRAATTISSRASPILAAGGAAVLAAGRAPQQHADDRDQPEAISGGARKNSPWPSSTIAASASTAAPAIVAARLRSVGACPGIGSSGTSTQAAR